MNQKTKKLAVMGILTALSIVFVLFVHFPLFPGAPFLEYDPADIPILIGAFAYGPLAGILMTVAVSVIQGITVSVSSGYYGVIMHVIATSTLVIVASSIYKARHTRRGAVIGLACGTLAMAGVMMVANHFITPLFMTVPVEVVDAMLVPLILPFNLLKAGINSVLTFVVYKSVSRYIIKGEVFGKKKTALDNQA